MTRMLMWRSTVLVLFFLSYSDIFSQTNITHTSENSSASSKFWRHIIWGNDDDASVATGVPEKWKSESVVVLGRWQYMEVSDPGLMRVDWQVNKYIRHRVKLMDKKGVEDFSHLEFPHIDFLVKVVKPDGREVEINNSLALVLENQKSSGVRTEKKYKLPIPDLEPGDILDYGIYSKGVENTYGYQSKQFDYNYVGLPEDYPICFFQMKFKLDQHFYLNLACQNFEAELLETQSMGNAKGYELVVTDIEKSKQYQFYNQLRNIPIVKYQITYISTWEALKEEDMIRNGIIYGKKGKIKSHLNATDLSNIALLIGQMKGPFYDVCKSKVKELKRRGKSLKKSGKGSADIARELYYYLRESFFLNASVERYYVKNNYMYTDRRLSELEFGIIFSRALRMLGIDHHLILTTPVNLCDISEAIIVEELAVGVKMKFDSTEVYAFNPDLYTQFGEIPAILQGANAKMYKINFQSDGNIIPRELPSSDFQIPVASYLSNYGERTITMRFDNREMENYTLTRHNIYCGAIRYSKYPFTVYPYDFLEADQKKYNIKSWIDASEESEMRGIKRQILRQKELERSEKEDLYTKFLQEGYGTKHLKVDSFRLTSIGRNEEKACLVYDENVKLDAFVTKIDDDVLINIGKIVAWDFSVDTTLINREADIHTDFGDHFKCKLEFILPEGYTVSHYKTINTVFKNECGEIMFYTKMDGKNLVAEYDVSIFKGNYSRGLWPQFIELLDQNNKLVKENILLSRMQ